jgi:hypothetical protein
MKVPFSRTLLVLLATAAVAFAGAPLAGATNAPRQALVSRTQYTADAYGSYANVGTVIKAGKSAVVSLGTCGTLTPPISASNTVSAVSVPPYVTTGLVNTTASATNVSGTQTAKATSDVHSANVLSGLITASEVKAVSATSHDAQGFHVSSAGSLFVNLVVAGIPIVGLPAPNTRINLAGFGYVILNEQKSTFTSTSASLTVNMIHVFVTLPNPLVPVGTEIIVAHAASGLATSIGGTLDGFAYGTSAQLGGVFLSGKSAFINLGCLGTRGITKTNSIASISFPPEFTTGTVTDTAKGTVTSTTATGETTSTVEGANLVSALVTADVVKADAHSFTDGTTFTFADDGSSFLNLTVGGHPEINDEVGPNTRVFLAGLGTLWLKREITTPNSIEIRMIEIIVTLENNYGIPIGTNIRVAVAHASAH